MNLLDAICRSAFQPGQWEQLGPKDQAYVKSRVAEQLKGQPESFLRALASPEPGTPTLTLDDDLQVSYATQAHDTSGTEEQLIRRANELGYLFHGYDPRGTPIFTQIQNLDRHMAIVGTSGTGKSNQVARYFIQLASQGGPMILIDPHAELIRDILPRLPKERLRDVVYINPADLQRSWGINLLQFGRTLLEGDDVDPDAMEHVLEVTVQTIVQALSVIQEDESGYSAGVSIQSALHMAAQAAAEYSPNATFVDVYQIIANRRIPELIKDHIHTQAVRQYVEDTLPHLRTEYLERVRNKLQKFLSTAMVNMFCRRQECKSLKHLIEGNKIILIDLDRDGLPYQVSNLIGFLLVTLVMLVVDHRKAPAGGELRPLYLVVDEFQNVASRSTVRWFAEARKRRAGIIVAFQHLDQLPEDVRDALGNAATWCVLRTSTNDARHLAPVLNPLAAPGAALAELTDLPQFQMRLQYDEEDMQNPARPMRRSTVTVHLQGLAPSRAPPGLIDVVRQSSIRRYGRATTPGDKETILAVGDNMTHEVLVAIYEAHQAVRNPDYYMGDEGLLGEQVFRRAQGARSNGLVSSTLVRQLLALKGMPVTMERFKALRQSLVLRKLVSVRTSGPGFDETVLLPKGLEAIRNWLVPGNAGTEGGERHKTGLLWLYQALSRISAMAVEVPVQGHAEYTPDLVIHVPQRIASWPQLITAHRALHLQVEVTTADNTSHALGNLVRGLKADALPVYVLPCQDTTIGLDAARAFHGRLLDAATGHQGQSPAMPEVTEALRRDPSQLFQVWIVTPAKQLWRFDALRDQLLSLSLGQETTPQEPVAAESAAQPVPTGRSGESRAETRVVFERIVHALMLESRSGRIEAETVHSKLKGAGYQVDGKTLHAWITEMGLWPVDSPQGHSYRFH